jgi:hypothetical protein
VERYPLGMFETLLNVGNAPGTTGFPIEGESQLGMSVH